MNWNIWTHSPISFFQKQRTVCITKENVSPKHILLKTSLPEVETKRAIRKGISMKMKFWDISFLLKLILNQQTKAFKFHFQDHLVNLVPVRVSLMCKSSVKASIHHVRHR